MFDSAILDVAIGLAFIFLLVSLLVTAVSEILSGWLKWRSTHLWDGLEHLLQSADARNQLYAHPLIKGLARVDIEAPDWKGGRNGPSYIPSRTFALALIDVLRRPHQAVDDLERRLQAAVADVSDPARAFAEIERIAGEVSASDAPEAVKRGLQTLVARVLPPLDPTVVNELKQQVRTLIARVPSADRAAAQPLVDWLAQHADRAPTYLELRATLQAAMNAMPLAGLASPAEQLRVTLDGVLDAFPHGKPESVVREVQAFANGAARRWLQDASNSLQGTVAALSPLLHDAADDIDRFRENIEIWFNDGMNRVSGWYKRHVSIVHGGVAIVLAVAMNIDALQITRTLWREPTLRQTLVANAEKFVDERSADVNEPDPDPQTTASADGKELKITAKKVRILPGEVAEFTITLPEPAAKDLAVPVTRLTPSVLLSSKNADFAAEDLSLKPKEGAKEVGFFVKAMRVTGVTPTQLTVAAQGMEASPTIIVMPQGDQRFAAVREQIGTLGLPIGWSCATDAKLTPDPTAVGGPFWCSTPPGNSGRRWTSVTWLAVWFKDVLSMVFGWMITAAAASLGAPFWFDMLKRIVSVRSSGKAPEERPLKPKEVPQPLEPGQRPREADLINALKP